MEFFPHSQVLADRIVVHTRSRADLVNVLVKCYSDNGAESKVGYIKILHEEAVTIGWNCEIDPKLLRVPRVTRGVIQSQQEDDQETRTRRGRQQFTIQMKNSAGHEIIRFANDRILPWAQMHKKHQLLGTNTRWSLRPRAEGVHWPTVISATVSSSLYWSSGSRSPTSSVGYAAPKKTKSTTGQAAQEPIQNQYKECFFQIVHNTNRFHSLRIIFFCVKIFVKYYCTYANISFSFVSWLLDL